MKKITAFSIDEELISWIEEQAEAEDRSKSYIVNKAIKKAMRT